MRRYLTLFACLAVAASTARANLVIALDNPDQTGSPGDTLVFTGILSNAGSSAVFLNSADLNLAGGSFTPNFIDPFLNNVPLFLDPGQSTVDIELFDIALNNPFTDVPGTYVGNYALVGGVDVDAQDVLNSANFSVTVNVPVSTVPEPSSLLLMTSALIIMRLRRSKKGSSPGY